MESYTRLAIAPTTPTKVEAFIRDTADLFIADVHAMLRLPLPEQHIAEACNFTIASTLLGFISGTSVVLYDPRQRNQPGPLFKEAVENAYPWDTEPATGVQNGAAAARMLYHSFRNPLVHNLGHHNQPVRRISRFRGPGMSEHELEIIERATTRPPDWVLHNASTLRRHPSGGIELSIEPFYWGVREMVRRLTTDSARMAIADARL